MRHSTPERQRVVHFLLLQASSVLAAGALSYLTNPARLIWLPTLALFACTYTWSKVQVTPCSRTFARTLATASGALFGLLSAVLFTWIVANSPEHFDVPSHMIPVLGLFIGAGAALGALIISLCGIDTAGIGLESD